MPLERQRQHSCMQGVYQRKRLCNTNEITPDGRGSARRLACHSSTCSAPQCSKRQQAHAAGTLSHAFCGCDEKHAACCWMLNCCNAGRCFSPACLPIPTSRGIWERGVWLAQVGWLCGHHLVWAGKTYQWASLQWGTWWSRCWVSLSALAAAFCNGMYTSMQVSQMSTLSSAVHLKSAAVQTGT